MTAKKRTLICSLVAIASGLFGAYLGGQISVVDRTNQCQTLPQGFKSVCALLVTPEAAMRGSTTGLWVGTIVGAFVGGLATHKEGEAEMEEKARREK
ncbi:hypothetical protein [Microcoleus sp. FACHB-672]|uniref:hypothetical protein n=1 Tax=Microcoleus sp. FACHB-672 TaxID=2692825 RepID=UPI0016843655|nr:hypothetical protein [Microcoleus sp. FACHB-672]MBD2040742.1 hypothetical protein [Microcoleus sp. FACHB-672]